MNQPLISLITVVYNSEKFIEETLKSVSAQKSRNFEYIIIDGSSTDNTLKIIDKYSLIITLLVSEPDKGLYDAMNKGLHLAKGKFVWFINSGDKLFDENTILNIENLYKENPQADVIYGQTQLIDENGNIIGMRKKTAPNPLNVNSLKMGLMVCHQSILVDKNIAVDYDLTYKVAADYQWVLMALKNARHIVYSQKILSQYLENGFSANNKKTANKERLKIMLKHFGVFSTIWSHIKILFRYIKENK